MELDMFMNLLLKQESETLDFKREFHDSNLKLVHDILCLSNSYSEENRFLIFGVSDTKDLFGVAGDGNRKNNANIQDLLRASQANRFPDVIMHSVIHDSKEFDILEIKNRPDKPFFLLRDKAEKGKTLRAGVVYTRLGDTNTPLGESAPEDRMELMWRERFGIGMPPMDRVLRLLEDDEQWERPTENELHHRVFPEFVIRNGDELNNPFTEDWTDKFLDKSARSFCIEIRYFGTLLKSYGFVICDGGRYTLPIPNLNINGFTFSVDKRSISYKIAVLKNGILKYNGETLDNLFQSVGVEVL